MKNIKAVKSSILAKSIAWILLMINICILAGSIAGAYTILDSGLYRSTYEQEREKVFSTRGLYLGQEMFFRIIEDEMKDKELQHYDNMSLKYGIIYGGLLEDVEKFDINDSKVYIRRNFTETKDINEVNIKYMLYDGKDYWIVYFADYSYIEKKNSNLFACLNRIITLDMSDEFVWADACLKLIYAFKNSMVAIMVISVLLILTSLIFLIAAAGHRKKNDGIVPSFLDKLPFDILSVLFIALESFLLMLGDNCYGELPVIYILILCGVVTIVLFLLSIAVRIKRGGFFKNTLVYWLGRMICAFISMLYKNIGILWKTILIMFAIAAVELVVIGCSCPGEEGMIMMLWIIEKVIMFALIIYIVVQMKTLQKGSEALAKGDLNRTVETQKMLPEFRKHAENLNRIGEGMAEAVEEKMKSERLKTELITNVSHDIKTPLTSIINYVDLLEKADIQEENAREYLDVLKRQSERLKKLIEDLMEASKASTGNLPVNMEKLEAGVILTQISGEYEEKLEENNLKLILTKPDTPLYIEADGRHLYRVIDNLMNNAIKYSLPGSRVYIDLAECDKKVVFVFKNMSKYQLNISSNELMERFVRGDSSRNTEGNGLGLSIAGSLMELMKSKLKLSVDGDLFKVTLELNKIEKSI